MAGSGEAGGTITFGGYGNVGPVAGADAHLLGNNNSDTQVTISIAAPLSETIGIAGAYDNQALTYTDFNIVGASANLAGANVGIGLGYSREHDALTLNLQGGIVASGQAQIVIVALPLNPAQCALSGVCCP